MLKVVYFAVSFSLPDGGHFELTKAFSFTLFQKNDQFFAER
ncbi:hypothetical protein [Gabonibacter chumensis]|nr:hypothetical protein [Gabonibacter chumensis]MCR9010929.1 hypothetical protein [Gabonibacter chumensis]